MDNNQKLNELTNNISDNQQDLLNILDDLWSNIDYKKIESLDNNIAKLKKILILNVEFQNISKQLILELESLILYQNKNNHAIKNQNIEIKDEDNKKQKLTLSNNWTGEKPSGYIFRGSYISKRSWIDIYISILEDLNKIDKNKLQTIPDNNNFLSNRNNKYFSREKTHLRIPIKFDNFYIESNLNSNLIRDNIKSILNYFSIKESEITFLKR
jgi:hypothetical protein